MLYITTALYDEASPYIELLGLKKDVSFNKIRVYSNENAVLAVTGTGVLAAVSSLSYVLGRMQPSRGDVFLNVGICGGRGVTNTYVCRKLSLFGDERAYFCPDMIYMTGFDEAELVTYPKPIGEIPKGVLVDTEGYGLAFAASAFFSPHRMFFIKTVSDEGDHDRITHGYVRELMEKNAEKIAAFALSIPHEETLEELSADELCEIEKLRMSTTQTKMLKDCLYYYRLRGGDVLKLLRELPEVKTKQEGRETLDRIRRIAAGSVI